ncbi:MAG: 2-octaprenyl-6-methoxyphenol hydroxylase [Candidatus Celerinatantimonas neptuna]|nr:MAG: 2-octaprenyl-6-methoxyphenol hydroxylase [Candidatus Celerinatantimonas neptuna]
MVRNEFDLIISGGGMVGATLALFICEYAKKQHQNLPSIAILEAHPLNYGSHPGFDGRAIALASGSIDLYRDVNFWKRLAPFAQNIEQINVSDRGHWGQVQINAQEYGIEQLGAVVELAHVGREIHQILSQYQNISLFCPARLEHVHPCQDTHQVVLDNGQKLSGKLLVGADGGSSKVAELMHLERHQLDFGQSALIANLACSKPHQQHAFERFSEHGPVALLPMTDERWSLVWCVPREQQDFWLNSSDEYFLSGLQQVFGYRVGRFQTIGRRDGYPLVLTQHRQLFAHRTAIIGNAAHSLHPIAGQGFNLGIRDAAVLAKLLCHYDDPGSYQCLHDFQAQRQQDIELTVGLTSALAIGFSSRDKLSVIARNLGLSSMQYCTGLKSTLVRRTLGQI